MKLNLKVWTNKANGQMKVDLPSRAFSIKPKEIQFNIPKNPTNNQSKGFIKLIFDNNLKGGNTLRK